MGGVEMRYLFIVQPVPTSSSSLSRDRGGRDEVMGKFGFEFVPFSGRGRDEVKLSVNFGTRWDEVKSK